VYLSFLNHSWKHRTILPSTPHTTWMNGNYLVWLSGHPSKYPLTHRRSYRLKWEGLMAERSKSHTLPSLPSPWNARWCTGTMLKPTRVIQQTPSSLGESRWCTSYVPSPSHLQLCEWDWYQDRADKSRKIPSCKTRMPSSWWSTQRS